MHRRRSRLQPERLRKDHRRGSKGSEFNVSSPKHGTRNAEPETPKVKHGTTNQRHRFVFSVVDAVRGDRDWSRSARTVAVCPDRASSLYGAASADLFESRHSRDSRTLGGFLQRITL